MTVAYDLQDRLVQEIGFDGRSQTYAYDAVGRLIDKIDSQDFLKKIFPERTKELHSWQAATTRMTSIPT
jgi:YD repeat-containing protein